MVFIGVLSHMPFRGNGAYHLISLNRYGDDWLSQTFVNQLVRTETKYPRAVGLCAFILSLIIMKSKKINYTRLHHGRESRGLNGRVHRISCRYSDKTSKKTYHTFLNTQPIFIKQSTHTS